jgi:hypothetical protein
MSVLDGIKRLDDGIDNFLLDTEKKKMGDRFNEDHAPKFSDMIQVTFFVHKNYNPDLLNTFSDMNVKQLNYCVTNLKILKTFVKIIQSFVCPNLGQNVSPEQSTLFFSETRLRRSRPQIFMRYWVNVENPRQDAFTFAVGGISQEELNSFYEELDKEYIFNNDKISLKSIAISYLKTCNIRLPKQSKRSMINEYLGLEEEEEGEEEEEEDFSFDLITGDELFSEVFSYQRTTSKLHLEDDTRNVATYVSAADFLVNRAEYFYWSAIEETHFPWLNINQFEIEAKAIIEERANEGGVHFDKTKSLRVAFEENKPYRYVWKGCMSNDDLLSIDDNDEGGGGGGGTSGRRRRRPRRPPKPPKLMKKDYKKKKILMERLPSSCIVSPAVQPFKQPTFVLTAIFEKVREEYKDAPMFVVQEKIDRIFDDFWLSGSNFEQLPPPLKALLVRHKKNRKKNLRIPMGNKKVGIAGNFLRHFFRTIRIVYNLDNTMKVAVDFFLARDSALVGFSALGINVYVCGPPGTGKSHAVKIVERASIPGTILQNTVRPSSKADMSRRNDELYGTIIFPDAGPMFSETREKMGVDHLANLQAFISKISEGFVQYKFLDCDKNKFGIFARKAFRIVNQFRGSINVIGNRNLYDAALRDRMIIEYVGGHGNNGNFREEIISDIFLENNTKATNVKNTSDEIFKQLQADVAIGLSYVSLGASATKYNVRPAMMIANFIFNEIKKRNLIFTCGARNFNKMISISIVLAAYKTVAGLCFMEGSKYSKKREIDSTSEYCKDFKDRLVVSYESVIPSICILMNQFIDSTLLSVLEVIVKNIFKVTKPLRTAADFAEYNTTVIHDDNFTKNEKIKFFTVGEKSYNFARRDGGRNDNNNSSSNFNRGTSRVNLFDDVNTNEEQGDEGYVDPNYLVFETTRSFPDITETIHFHLTEKIGAMAVDTKLKELYQKRFNCKNLIKRVKNLKGFEKGSQIENLIEFEENDAVSEEVVNFLKKGWDSNKSIRSFIIPVVLANFINSNDVDGYEVLKDVVEEKLPYKNQGILKTFEGVDGYSPDNHRDIHVTGIKINKPFRIEDIVISPNDDSPQNFVMRNPKHLTTKTREYYAELMEFFSEEDGGDENDEYGMDFIKKEVLEFDSSLLDMVFSEQVEVAMHGVSDVHRLLAEDDFKQKLYNMHFVEEEKLLERHVRRVFDIDEDLMSEGEDENETNEMLNGEDENDDVNMEDEDDDVVVVIDAVEPNSQLGNQTPDSTLELTKVPDIGIPTNIAIEDGETKPVDFGSEFSRNFLLGMDT